MFEPFFNVLHFIERNTYPNTWFTGQRTDITFINLMGNKKTEYVRVKINLQ